ncbi:MAG: hypothetical protein WBP59_17795 [Ilumatobacteraceae bacterium]
MTEQPGRGRFVALAAVVSVMLVSCGGGATDDADDSGSSVVSTIERPEDDQDDSAESSPASTIEPAGAVAIDLDTPANPASVDLSLDEGGAGAAVIGPAGGSLSATGADGISYTLDVPERALLSGLEITMTPLAGATGAAIGDTFVAGVELQPSGLHLLVPATLTISGTDADGEVTGWGAEGGQDVYLTTSESSSGVTTMPVFHFSEFGLAGAQMRELMQAEGVIPENTDARISQALELAPDELAMIVATEYALALTVDGVEADESGNDYALIEAWTSDVVTHVTRLAFVVAQRGWGPDTPGFTELQDAMYGLIDGWFDTMDDVLVVESELCEEGHVDAGFRILRQALIGYALLIVEGAGVATLDAPLRKELIADHLYPWADTGLDCLALGMTWQARIITSGGGFLSDISIGAEARNIIGDEFDSMEWLTDLPSAENGQGTTLTVPSESIETALEVEWIEGFFADPMLGCTPADGLVEMEHEDLDVRIPNLGNFGDVSIDPNTPFFVRVRIIEPITIGCSPVIGITEEAGYPFHLGALELLNGIFDVSGNWYFQMYYEPGGGEVGRFEQGSPIDGEGLVIDGPQLDFPGGKYELWQVATVFQPPAS